MQRFEIGDQVAYAKGIVVLNAPPGWVNRLANSCRQVRIVKGQGAPQRRKENETPQHNPAEQPNRSDPPRGF